MKGISDFPSFTFFNENIYSTYKADHISKHLMIRLPPERKNSYDSVDEFERELRNYIWWYNNKKIKLRLKGMSPVQ